MRADAARNRAAILAEARRLMVERGANVGMDEIAAQAGVAVGTLYRHFPTKTDLIAAAIEDSIERVATDLESALAAVDAGGSPSEALATMFRVVAARHSADRALKNAASGSSVLYHATDGPTTSAATERALRTLEELLDRIDRAGGLAAPTTVMDLIVLLDGVPDASLGDVQRERYVDLVLRGLLA